MKNEIEELSFSFGLAILNHHQKLVSRRMAALATQLLKSGTSVGAHYREAQYAESRADFIHKLSIARKECNEAVYWLDLLHTGGYMDSSEYHELSRQAKSIIKIVTSIILTTRSRINNP